MGTDATSTMPYEARLRAVQISLARADALHDRLEVVPAQLIVEFLAGLEDVGAAEVAWSIEELRVLVAEVGHLDETDEEWSDRLEAERDRKASDDGQTSPS